MSNLKTMPKLRFPEFKDDWYLSTIRSETNYVDYRGKTPIKTKSGVLLVTAKNIKEGHIDYLTSQEFIAEISFDDVMSRGKVKIGDVLFTTEAPMGNVAQVDNESIALAQRVIKFRGKSSLSNDYLKHYLLSATFTKKLNKKAIGTTVKGIKGSELHKMPIMFGCYIEQQKIADFISSVDKKISLLKEKHALIKKYKQGVMQKLFSQELRFKDENGDNFPDWQDKIIGDFMIESRIKGSNGLNAQKITVKLWGKGVFQKNENILGSENTQYYKRKAGQFLYSKLDFLNCAFGIVPDFLDGFETTVDLPCFDIGNEVNKYLILELIKQKNFYKKYGDMADGSRKAKRIHAKDFLSFPIKLPTLNEQNKISDFLDSLDKKIKQVQKQIEHTQTFKKGLLQQMFV